MKEVTINVKGMVCNGCENRIKNALKTIEGVENVSANHNTGIVSITLNNEVEKNVLEKK